MLLKLVEIFVNLVISVKINLNKIKIVITFFILFLSVILILLVDNKENTAFNLNSCLLKIINRY